MEYSYRMMVLFDCEMCNPNACPVTGSPRIRAVDDRGFITAQAIKYKVKRWFNYQGYPLLHYSENSDETVRNKILGEASVLDENEIIERSLKYIDVRLFGALDISGTFALKIKAPVSISEAISYEPVCVSRYGVNRGYKVDVKVSENGKVQNKGSSYANEKEIIEYGFYSFFSGVDSRPASKLDVTDEDIEKLIDAFVHLFDIDYSTMRPMGSMTIRNVVVWRWKGIKKVSDVELKDSVKIHIRDVVTKGHGRERYKISIDDLSEHGIETCIY